VPQVSHLRPGITSNPTNLRSSRKTHESSAGVARIMRHPG
jgi:hypothetical protein